MSETDKDPDGAWYDSGEPAPVAPRRSLVRLGLLVAVFVGAVALMARLWAGATFLLFPGPTAQCGDIGAREALRARDPASVPPLEHGTWCHLKGVVAYPSILATGQENPKAPSLSERNRGQKFITQLEGDRVFVVVPGDRVDVINHRIEFGTLFGFHVDETGRILDPDADPRYREVAGALRTKFQIPAGDPIRLFDTTDDPLSHWFIGLAMVVVLFIAVRAVWSGVALIRGLGEERRARREVDRLMG